MKPVIMYLDPVTSGMKALLEQFAGQDLQMQYLQDEGSCSGADYIIVAAEKVPAERIAEAQTLRLIQKTGVGTDNIDIRAAGRMGILVCNTPGVNAAGVAELTIAHILSLYRKLPLLNNRCHSGEWPMWEYRLDSYEMNGKTHGIIGFGSIGQTVANLSRAFGTRIVYYDACRVAEEIETQCYAQYMELNELLPCADIITLHVPLTPSTRGLIGKEHLALMRPMTILVNMARGGVVNEAALAEALRAGQIGGAACDTLEGEPNIKDNVLLSCPNFYCTPHVGAGTLDTLRRVLNIAFSNIRALESGVKPKYIVNE